MTIKFSSVPNTDENRKAIAKLNITCGGCGAKIGLDNVSYYIGQTSFDDSGAGNEQQPYARSSSQFTPTKFLDVRTVCNKRGCPDHITYDHDNLWKFVAELIGFKA